jgi:hypothetical protein
MLTAMVLLVEQPFAAMVDGLKTTLELAGNPVAEKAMFPA